MKGSVVTAIEGEINSDSGIRHLPIQVSSHNGSVILSGSCGTFYQKSLITEAAKRALRFCEDSEISISNRVEVLKN